MPDIKILTSEDGSTVIAIPKYNDATSGIMALAQIVALMLLDPTYGNLKSMLRSRISNDDIGQYILAAVDKVETIMLDEQGSKIISDEEILSLIAIEGILISGDNVDITLKVINILNEQTTFNI